MTNLDPQFSVPEKPARPSVVTAAVGVQVIVGVVTVLSAILTVVFSQQSVDAVVAELKRQDAPQQAIDGSSGTIGTVLGAGMSAVFAIALLVLAIYNMRGTNGTRIATWILSGVTLLCSVFGIAAASMLGNMSTGGIDMGKAQEAAADALPAWYSAYNVAAQVISVVGLIAVVVLLALPAANAFFRKPQQQVVLPPEAQ